MSDHVSFDATYKALEKKHVKPALNELRQSIREAACFVDADANKEAGSHTIWLGLDGPTSWKNELTKMFGDLASELSGRKVEITFGSNDAHVAESDSAEEKRIKDEIAELHERLEEIDYKRKRASAASAQGALRTNKRKRG
jgi:hypothetical protein